MVHEGAGERGRDPLAVHPAGPLSVCNDPVGQAPWPRLRKPSTSRSESTAPDPTGSPPLLGGSPANRQVPLVPLQQQLARLPRLPQPNPPSARPSIRQPRCQPERMQIPQVQVSSSAPPGSSATSPGTDAAPPDCAAILSDPRNDAIRSSIRVSVPQCRCQTALQGSATPGWVAQPASSSTQLEVVVRHRIGRDLSRQHARQQAPRHPPPLPPCRWRT